MNTDKIITADYIKAKLGAQVTETSLIPQRDGDYIVMERCLVDGLYKILIVYDTGDDDKLVAMSL